MHTNWTSVSKYYGLQQPYNFRIAVPIILSALTLLAILLVCAFMFSMGELSIGTARFFFFTYISLMLCVAAACSRVTFLSVGILIWCALELSLAISSTAIAKAFQLSIFPPDNFMPSIGNRLEDRSMFHPLLLRIPTPNWKGHVIEHLDPRNKDRGVFKDWPINWPLVEKERFTFSHNSLGLRGREITPDDLSREMIFLYGGSTTYDITVTDGKTWPERLQSDLNNKFTIVNFGMPGHSTVEHLIHTVFYQGMIPKKPVCSIYYVGWNELWHAHSGSSDGAYADSHALMHVLRRPDLRFSAYSPALRLISAGLRTRFDTIPRFPFLVQREPKSGPDEQLERIFSDHIRTITSLDLSKKIKPIFVGQIMNREFFERARQRSSALLIRNEDFWALQEHLNLVLKDAALASGARYVDAGIENFHFDDFIDSGHFSAEGSQKFSKLIYQQIGEYCQQAE